MTVGLSAGFIRSIDANRTIKDGLIAAIGNSRARLRISVTDLGSLMQAFFSRTRPEVTPSPDKLQLMMAGTGFHEVLGPLISSEEYLEQLLEFEGIVGKVDIYEDFPVELKTTSKIPTDIYKGRSSYFEQLGMYCVMANKDKGRLYVYQREDTGQPHQFRVYEARFNNIERITSEMRLRRDLLNESLAQKTPSQLPQCKWLYMGCDYSRICSCRDKSPDSPIVSREEVEITEIPDIAEEIQGKLLSVQPSDPKLILNDLVFPRKAAMRRTRPSEVKPVTMPELQQKGFRYQLYSALRDGSRGQFQSVPVQLGSILDKVDEYQDIPTILRTTKLKEMVQREQLPSFFSHYFDRLALTCALRNIRQGRLIIYYESIKSDKFMVYDVTFHSRNAILDEARRRLDLLEQGADHSDLPPCPTWMTKFCEFAPGCGCHESEESQEA